MTLISAPGWPWHRRAGACRAEIAALAFAVALSAYVVVLVRNQDADVAACVAATAMTLPVAFARQAPLAVAAVLAAAAAANELFFGHLFRCGAALPAVFFVAYLAGRACAGRVRALVLAGVLACAAIQCLYDPRLGAPVIVLMATVSGVFTGAGILVRRRAGLVAELRRRTGQLQEQREQTTALAVAAERARITAGISGILRERIDEICRLARPADDGKGPIDANFAAIERAGRDILDSMRQVVGTLRDAPTEPEPGLAELADLLTRATTAATRLSVDGPVRPLPASLELTGYRIIEQLLTGLRDEPSAQVEVWLRFAPDCLELRVAGPPAADCELRPLRSAVQAMQSGGLRLHSSSPGTIAGTIGTGIAVPALCYALGAYVRLPGSLTGLAFLTASLQWDELNPFPVMLTVGLWLAGRAVHSHRLLAANLRIRAFELDSEREQFAAETIRYERDRIARELHDVIAHSVSIIVIQASAGQRLPTGEPGAVELLGNIAELAREAATDISGLTGLLTPVLEHPLTQEHVEDLLARTAQTGVQLDFDIVGDVSSLPGIPPERPTASCRKA